MYLLYVSFFFLVKESDSDKQNEPGADCAEQDIGCWSQKWSARYKRKHIGGQFARSSCRLSHSFHYFAYLEAFFCMLVRAAVLNNALNYLWLLIFISLSGEQHDQAWHWWAFFVFLSHCLTSFLEKFCHSADSFTCSSVIGGLNNLLYTFTTRTCMHPPPSPHLTLYTTVYIHVCIIFLDIHVCVVRQNLVPVTKTSELKEW